MTETDTDTIARHLLGQLAEADADRLEARLLAEPELFRTAETVEDDLVDRYARGEMNGEERAQFERYLLGAERIRERVAFARALASCTETRREAAYPGAGVVVAHRTRRLWASPRLAWAAALILALGAGWATSGVLRLRSDLGRTRSELTASRAATEQARGRADALEHAAARATISKNDLRKQVEAQRAAAKSAAERIAELEKRQLSGTDVRVRRPVDQGKKVESALQRATLFLTLATRGPSHPETLRLGAASEVELQLDLGEQRPSEKLIAIVRRGGQPIWRESGLDVESVESETMVSLVLPRQSLAEGRYSVELQARTDDHEVQRVGAYDFEIAP